MSNEAKNPGEVTLCVSNGYKKKFYLNENFNQLPQSIRDELKIMCVLYTEDVEEFLSLFLMRTERLNSRQAARRMISCMMRLEACSKSNSTRTRRETYSKHLRCFTELYISEKDCRGIPLAMHQRCTAGVSPFANGKFCMG